MKGLDTHICGDNCDPAFTDEDNGIPVHWHVSRHRDDDDVFITPDIYSALDYAATELQALSEFEHDGIAPSGEAGDFEGAYRAWVRSNELDALYETAVHPCQQYNRTDPDEDETYVAGKHRAPLYQGYGGDAKLMETAKRAVDQVNGGSALAIWECSDELVYLNENYTAFSDEDNGFPVHAEDWEPGDKYLDLRGGLNPLP